MPRVIIIVARLAHAHKVCLKVAHSRWIHRSAQHTSMIKIPSHIFQYRSGVQFISNNRQLPQQCDGTAMQKRTVFFFSWPLTSLSWAAWSNAGILSDGIPAPWSSDVNHSGVRSPCSERKREITSASSIMEVLPLGDQCNTTGDLVILTLVVSDNAKNQRCIINGACARMLLNCMVTSWGNGSRDTVIRAGKRILVPVETQELRHLRQITLQKFGYRQASPVLGTAFLLTKTKQRFGRPLNKCWWCSCNL